MKGFSVDSQSKESTKTPDVPVAVFVPLDTEKPEFRHLKQSGRMFVAMVSKVPPSFERAFKG
jgi:hypothetical protein